MLGKILQYNSKGEGEIQGEDANVYTLAYSNWRDYHTEPIVGLEVKFIPDTKHNLALQIRVVSDVHKIDEKSKDNTIIEKKSKKVEIETREEKLKNIATNFKTTSSILDNDTLNMLDGIKYIPITRSYQSVFTSFFEDALKISENQKLDNSDNELNYPLMRRFLITTYEHLVDKDPQFIKDDLVSLKRNLENLFIIYKDLNHKLANPNVAIENIFLSEQEIYNNVLTKIEKNNQRILRLNSVSEDMEKIVHEKSEKLKTIKKNLPEFEELDTSIKKTRTRYANAIDELDKLNKQNEYLNEISSKFSNTHKVDFLDYFKTNSLELISTITKMMNLNAYKFDKYMWDCAKKSKAIRKFFIEASIEGSFSSRTFLRYFINTIDFNKAKSDQIELKNLLEYLDKQDRKKVLVVDDKSYMLSNIKYFINHIDNFYRVISKTPTDAKLQISNLKVDFIILNANINSLDVVDFIKTVQFVHKDKVPEIILLGEKFKVDFVLAVKKLNIHNFVSTSLNELRMYNALTNILLDEEEQELILNKDS